MRKVASTRWSKMLTCQESRIGHGNGLRPFIGERNWHEFISYAKKIYKSSYMDAFCPRDGVLRCVGLLDEPNARCPHNFHIDLHQLGSKDAKKVQDHKDLLRNMHLDHAYDLHHTCEMWKKRSKKNPPQWDFNIEKDWLCSLLFGVDPDATGSFTPLQFRGSSDACNCHRNSTPHYNHVIQVEV